MDTPDLLELFVAPIHGQEWPYMIVGSIASIQYGEPRYTADVDITLALPAAQSARLSGLFPAPTFYCPPPEVLLVEFERQERAHFNVIHIASGFKADFYPCRQQPYFAWAMAKRRALDIAGRPWWFAPPEYVIIWKLIFFREGRSEKHLRDISSMLQVHGDDLDKNVIEAAVLELALEREWSLAANFA